MRLCRLLVFSVLLCGIGVACGSSGGAGGGAGSGAGAGTSGGGKSASGGSAGGGAGKGGAGGGGGADTAWLENGALRSATYASLATRHTTTVSDTFNFVATDFPASATLSFAASSQALLDGTYGCGATLATSVAVSYDNVAPADETCSITVTFTTDAAGQQRATGTFEAVVTIPAGTKTLTDGHFDLAVMPL
jgi:hypothetical protein